MAIIVGDIHGDVDKARAFLEYKPTEEHVALGDYLDSYSEPLERQLECLQLLMDSQAVLLLGNHECHYLQKALFRFAGFNYDHLRVFQDLLEQNIQRFKAAHAVDGWLCTHAGLHQGLTARDKNVDRLAALLNRSFDRYLENRHINKHSNYRYQSIFWFNFLVEATIVSPDISQIFGHVELPHPDVEVNYVALDTTNFSNSCWLYDTEISELVQIPLSPKPDRVRFRGGSP